MTSQRPPITTLPPAYQQVHVLSVSKRKTLIWLNVLSLLPLMISGLVVFGLLLIYHSELKAPLVIRVLPEHIPSGAGLALVLLILPLHEWIHGLSIAHYGHKPRYGAKWMVLFATSDNALFRRNEFILIALAPLLVITLGGLVLIAFVPLGIAEWIGLAISVNAAGAIGDIWMAATALRYDVSVLIRDEQDSMRIFAPVSSAPDPFTLM